MGIPRVRPSRCHPWDGAAKGWIGVRATLGTRWPPGKWPEAQSRSAPPLSPQKVTAQPMAAKDIPQNAGLAKRPKGKEGGMRRADSRTPTWPRERGEPNRNGSWDGAAAPTPPPSLPPSPRIEAVRGSEWCAQRAQSEPPRGERSPQRWGADPTAGRRETEIPVRLKGEPALTPRADLSRVMHPADL